jgi:hypothetical protein
VSLRTETLSQADVVKVVIFKLSLMH